MTPSSTRTPRPPPKSLSTAPQEPTPSSTPPDTTFNLLRLCPHGHPPPQSEPARRTTPTLTPTPTPVTPKTKEGKKTTTTPWTSNTQNTSLKHRRSAVTFFFFLLIHYSCATYGDHDEIMYSPFPVRCPRSGGSSLAPFRPPPRPVPGRWSYSHQGKDTRKGGGLLPTRKE